MLEYDELAMGTVRRTADEVVEALETRARCIEEVLFAVEDGMVGFERSRSDLDWVGPAAMQFSWSADELHGRLRTAASALGESLRQARWAASAVSVGGAG